MWSKIKLLLTGISDIKEYLIIGAAVLGFGGMALFTFYLYAFNKGASTCEIAQAKAVIVEQTTTKKAYDKIDKATPDGGDKHIAIKFLLDHAPASNR